MKRKREARVRRSTIGASMQVTPYKGGGNVSELSAEQLAERAAKQQDLMMSSVRTNRKKG